jgi:branched-chain amino acid transport system ATP-binding protein
MAEPVLSIRDLRKSFGALKATDGVSLDLRPGEIHALIGPNGAGKTTLIHQIAGGITPDSGEIVFLGEDIGALGVAARARRGLGRSFQISSLAPEFSALRNVMLAVQSRQGSSFRFFRPVMRDRSLAWRPARTCRRPSFRMASAGSSKSPSRWRSGRRHSCSTSRWPAWVRKVRGR